MEKIRIKGIGNYYGGLNVIEVAGKYYFIIENYDTDFEELDEWQEISESLYSELLKHNDNTKEY